MALSNSVAKSKGVLANLAKNYKIICNFAHSDIRIEKVDDGFRSWDKIRVGVLGAPFFMGQVKYFMFENAFNSDNSAITSLIKERSRPPP